MRSVNSVLCALCLVSGAPTPASANVIYNFSGVFKPATGAAFTTALGGGSFDGTFVLPGTVFPTSGTTSLVSFAVNLRSSDGLILDTITKGVGAGRAT